MDTDTFNRLRKVVKNKFGIIVPSELSSRKFGELLRISDKYKMDWDDILRLLQGGDNNDLLEDFADVLTIPHTFFFREQAHFMLLANEILPQLAKENTNDLRLWSAATASGEEAVSIMLTIREFYGTGYNKINGGVLATDISKSALAKGVRGLYRKESIKHIPEHMALKWFRDEGDSNVIVSENIRNDILYRWINLTGPMPLFKGKFHVIFCRNVMLYFDENTRNQLIERLSALLYPGGWLIIGLTEDCGNAGLWLDRISTSVYRKRRGR